MVEFLLHLNVMNIITTSFYLKRLHEHALAVRNCVFFLFLLELLSSI